MIVLEIIKKAIYSSISILNGSSGWLIFSFFLAGILHNVLTPEKFQRMLGNKKISSLIKSTISGMLLPICSCGVIPLGLSMYYSGAYLGPTLAFMTATPIINPAAVILSLGLLGPQITGIYLIAGFTAPMVIGIIANRFGGSEICHKAFEEGVAIKELESEGKDNLLKRILSGLYWSLTDLGPAVSKYVIPGMLIGGLLLAVVPQEYIQEYLGNPGVISLWGIAAVGCVMYICAVGHIPLIAAIVASGAAPGVAITFLMAGAASNLPELISIYKLIGKRAAIIYSTTVIALSFFFGYVANKLLMPGFIPVLNFDRTKGAIKMANLIILDTPEVIKYLCSLGVFLFYLYSMWPKIRKFVISESV